MGKRLKLLWRLFNYKGVQLSKGDYVYLCKEKDSICGKVEHILIGQNNKLQCYIHFDEFFFGKVHEKRTYNLDDITHTHGHNYIKRNYDTKVK